MSSCFQAGRSPTREAAPLGRASGGEEGHALLLARPASKPGTAREAKVGNPRSKARRAANAPACTPPPRLARKECARRAPERGRAQRRAWAALALRPGAGVALEGLSRAHPRPPQAHQDGQAVGIHRGQPPAAGPAVQLHGRRHLPAPSDPERHPAARLAPPEPESLRFSPWRLSAALRGPDPALLGSWRGRSSGPCAPRAAYSRVNGAALQPRAGLLGGGGDRVAAREKPAAGLRSVQTEPTPACLLGSKSRRVAPRSAALGKRARDRSGFFLSRPNPRPPPGRDEASSRVRANCLGRAAGLTRKEACKGVGG